MACNALQGVSVRSGAIKKMEKTMASGRKTVDYETFAKCKSNFEMVKGLFREGLSIPQVCRYLGITEHTFYKWKTTYPEFESATVEGREAADFSVENALYKRATGFQYAERKIIKKNGEVVQEEIYQKQALPDPTSCAIWLNNRQPEKWKKEPNNENASQKAIEINVINAKTLGTKINSKAKYENKKSKEEVENND